MKQQMQNPYHHNLLKSKKGYKNKPPLSFEPPPVNAPSSPPDMNQILDSSPESSIDEDALVRPPTKKNEQPEKPETTAHGPQTPPLPPTQETQESQQPSQILTDQSQSQQVKFVGSCITCGTPILSGEEIACSVDKCPRIMHSKF